MPNDRVKVLLAFAGTGGTAEDISAYYEQFYDKHCDIRIYFNGCQDSNIGGESAGLGYIAPSLNTVSVALQACFDANHQFSLLQFNEKFKGSYRICKNSSITLGSHLSVSEFFLTGFSRGSVICYSVAKVLDKRNFPIHLLAIEPVPGVSRETFLNSQSGNADTYDLRACKNIKRATILIGTYSKQNTAIENKYFRQLAPLVHPTTIANYYLIPKKFHNEPLRTTGLHIRMFLNVDRNVEDVAAKIVEQTKFDRLYPIPRIIQQHLHLHMDLLGYFEYSPIYKARIYEWVHKMIGTIDRNQSFKVGQALLALGKYKTEVIDELFLMVQHSATPISIAVREFIVELDNIIEFIDEERKEKAQMHQKMRKILLLIQDYCKIARPSLNEKLQLQDQIFILICTFQSLLSQSTLTTAHIKSWLEQSPLFHLQLTQFIDESETFVQPPIAQISTIQHLARQLFYATDTERDVILKKPEIMGMIQTDPQVKEINLLLACLPNYEHRKMIYSAVKERLIYKPSEDLLSLMNYLSLKKFQECCSRLNWEEVSLSQLEQRLSYANTQIEPFKASLLSKKIEEIIKQRKGSLLSSQKMDYDFDELITNIKLSIDPNNVNDKCREYIKQKIDAISRAKKQKDYIKLAYIAEELNKVNLTLQILPEIKHIHSFFSSICHELPHDVSDKRYKLVDDIYISAIEHASPVELQAKINQHLNQYCLLLKRHCEHKLTEISKFGFGSIDTTMQLFIENKKRTLNQFKETTHYQELSAFFLSLKQLQQRLQQDNVVPKIKSIIHSLENKQFHSAGAQEKAADICAKIIQVDVEDRPKVKQAETPQARSVLQSMANKRTYCFFCSADHLKQEANHLTAEELFSSDFVNHSSSSYQDFFTSIILEKETHWYTWIIFFFYSLMGMDFGQQISSPDLRMKTF